LTVFASSAGAVTVSVAISAASKLRFIIVPWRADMAARMLPHLRNQEAAGG
jgi:hypothetical protein